MLGFRAQDTGLGMRTSTLSPTATDAAALVRPDCNPAKTTNLVGDSRRTPTLSSDQFQWGHHNSML